MNFKKLNFFVQMSMLVTLLSCSTPSYNKSVQVLDIDKFMGDWFVIAGRFTFVEDGAHNPIESYSWNNEENRVDINYTFNKDSFSGERKSIKQKAWIKDSKSKSKWQVSPFWPIKLDYNILLVANDYSWTAAGTPNGKYLWIMAKDWSFSKDKVNEVLEALRKHGFPTQNIIHAPQKWEDSAPKETESN